MVCAQKMVFPPRDQIFRAFGLCTFDSVRVVIIGQDRERPALPPCLRVGSPCPSVRLHWCVFYHRYCCLLRQGRCPSSAHSYPRVAVARSAYHARGQAEGLCFSVPKGVAVPSSLRNIYKVGLPEHDRAFSSAR